MPAVIYSLNVNSHGKQASQFNETHTAVSTGNIKYQMEGTYGETNKQIFMVELGSLSVYKAWDSGLNNGVHRQTDTQTQRWLIIFAVEPVNNP